MQRIAGIAFVISWLLCGCTIDTIFDGGAPVFLSALVAVIICAAILGGDD